MRVISINLDKVQELLLSVYDYYNIVERFAINFIVQKAFNTL